MGSLSVADETSFGRAPFEFLLQIPMAAGVVMLVKAVLVRAWATWAAPAQAGTAGHPPVHLGEIQPGGRPVKGSGRPR